MEAEKDYTHVVMTRFNLAFKGGGKSNDPAWLAGRFELFEKYCLPSIAAQEGGTFHWVVYFDENTPPPFRARIEACRRVHPFIAYYTPLFEAEGWPRSLGEVLPGRTPWILTTRLDNDDGLSRDHVARLQAALRGIIARRPERGSFNFTHGIVVSEGKVYAHDHLSNAFASQLEPWDATTRTCMSVNHMKMAEFGPIHQIGGPPAWIQVVHGGNISNKIRGRRVKPALAEGRFPPETVRDLRSPSSAELLVENLVLTPVRRGRDVAVALLRGQPLVSR